MKNISVVGAGLMGHGIATVFSMAGYQVMLHDVSEDALTRSQKLMSEVFRTLAEAGVIDPQASASLKDRIVPTTSLATAAAHADLIVEAVTEDVNIKRSVFSELDTLAPLTAVWASNTPSLNIFDLL